MGNDRWNRIHHLAAELCQLAPWKLIEETDLFGIASPVTGITWFMSVMGSAGEFRALAAYEGPYALSRFWELYDNEPQAAYSASVLTIPHMMLSFGSREQTDPVQAAMLEELPESFGGEWPEVKRIVPGLLPETPGDAWLDEFILLLEQTLQVLPRAMDNLMLLQPDGDEDVYLIREQGKGKTRTWKDKYRKVEFVPPPSFPEPSEEMRQSLSLLPKGNSVLQWHCQMLPLPLKEDGKPACFPFMVLLVNKRTGLVEAQQVLTPFPDYPAMVGQLPAHLFYEIANLGFRPRCIEVKDPLLHSMVHALLRPLGIGLIYSKQLRETEQALDAVTERLRRREG
jgi:hypothetical protein